jgi:hypothetical protein
MVHPSSKFLHARRAGAATGRVLVRVIMVVFGSLSAIGSATGKPALPPEITLPPKEYRP